ncbi:hypothetical protein [Schaalia sp. 19OD2882]|uniref:hypothetical protein n=1 Tax=Schaalia sp. 19OD2882 TaxID=2794089 RepID=UPI0020A6EFF8|nr:hypothetical protein [Schaalia sp. 19OD2882]
MNAAENTLDGRVALVTGVGRRKGIGFAVATRLAARGVDLVLAHHRPHDLDQPWGGDDLDALVAQVKAACSRPDQRVVDVAADLAEADAPRPSWAGPPRNSAMWTSSCATTHGLEATERWANWTPGCSTPTGPSTPDPRSC